MKKFTFFLFLILCWYQSIHTSSAQCPTVSTFTSSVTAATCPSNGAIQFSSSSDVTVAGGQGIPGTLYQITSGPASGGYQTTAQSSNRFEGLPPGSYTITITKEGCTPVTISQTVDNQYVPVTLNTAVSNVCPGGGAVGATITASANGSSTPLTYAFLKTTNANTPDANLTYGSASTFQVTAATGGYGTYLVRVKDQCGVFTTKMVDVVSTSRLARYRPYQLRSVDCATNRLFASLDDLASSNNIDPVSSPGYVVEVFDVTGNLPSPCAVPATTPIVTKTINTADDLFFNIPSTVRQVVFRTTSPCGDVDVSCVNFDTSPSFTPQVDFFSTLSCQTASGTNQVNLSVGVGPNGLTYPLTIAIKSTTTNTTLATDTWPVPQSAEVYTVNYEAGGYTLTLTDACGKSYTRTVVPPGAGTPVSAQTRTTLDCSVIEGTKRAWVQLTGGLLGLYDAGTQFALIAGPSGPINPAIAPFFVNYPEIVFNDLAPGTYTVQMTPSTSGCSSATFTFTVPANSPSDPNLVFSLGGSTNILCGGTGTITSTLTYNGYSNVSFELLNSGGSVISNNSTGQFANLPAGTYTVRAKIETNPCGTNLQATRSYTILPADTPPVITKKLGIVCESGSTSLATGNAYFEFNGVAPYLLEMKLAGTSVWSTQASNLSANTYSVNNLSSNATYDVRLTDNCGKSTVTTVSIRPLESLNVTNTAQPCVGQPYTLSAPELAGATYSWSKSGNVVSTSPNVNFGSFTAADNGTYVCTVTIGGCVIRTITVTLNSNNCNGPLPVSLIAFTATVLENQTVRLDWSTSMERNNAYFAIDRSKDLLVFETVSQIAAREGTVNQTRKYTYVDAQPMRGTSYYRLRQVDLDGTTKTSPAVSVVIRVDEYGVFPNPVSRDGHFTLNLDEPKTAAVTLYGPDGRVILLKTLGYGEASLNLKTAEPLQSGIYVLSVQERGQARQYRIVIH